MLELAPTILQSAAPPAPTALPNVLVVDDVAVNAELIARIIGSMCTVHTAASAAQGIEMARQHAPVLILLDVRMPEMDGFAMFRRLRTSSRTAHIPVIFLTASSDPHDEEVGLNLGAADFITKPFRPAVLQARVRNHLELVRQRQLLERMSHIDALTGIANRRAFDATLQREFQRMQRNRQTLALIMLDVDAFKSYNDLCGHLAGDLCLQQLAQAMAQCLHRPADLLARYGGEEFVCLLPETDHAGATKLAHDLHQTVRALALPHPQPRSQGPGHISISAGVAAAWANALPDSQTLLTMADARLYRAKHSGRNRVIDSDEDRPDGDMDPTPTRPVRPPR